MTVTSAASQRLAEFSARIHAKTSADPASLSIIGLIGQELQESEALLISLMAGNDPPITQPGDIEFGPLLYLLDTYFEGTLFGLPQTAITTAMWDSYFATWEGEGVVAGDGTLFNTSKYAGLDFGEYTKTSASGDGWLEAVINYFDFVLGYIEPATFGTNGYRFVLSGSGPYTIALTGDWGTGAWTDGSQPNCPALANASVINRLSPDFTIHLGDVYYSGTSAEESDNLLAPWIPGTIASFALNSNHEMYDGANGYFNTALASDGPFSLQQQTSYFSIEAPDWVVLGLDSAWDGTYENTGHFLYMYGRVLNQSMVQFIKDTNTTKSDGTPKTVIVLTHHNPILVDGSGYVLTNGAPQLWDDVVNALGSAPDYWYFGHIHNGIVYSSLSAAGSTNARCVGHGGLPFGNGYYLAQANENVIYYTDTPLSNPDIQQELRVLNGFSLLTLDANTVNERFYDQTGNTAWPS